MLADCPVGGRGAAGAAGAAEEAAAAAATEGRRALLPLPHAAHTGIDPRWLSSGHSSTGPTNFDHSASSKMRTSRCTPVGENARGSRKLVL